MPSFLYLPPTNSGPFFNEIKNYFENCVGVRHDGRLIPIGTADEKFRISLSHVGRQPL